MAHSENFAPAFSSFLIGHGQESQEYNGRLDLMSSMPLLQIPQYQQNQHDNSNFRAEAVSGNLERSPLSDLFFSVQNINALQEGIRYRVWLQTDKQYVIGRQNDTELKVVMRSIFLQYGQPRLGADCVEQVRDLNKLVLDWTVPEVLSNLKQYEVYRRDISTLPIPMERAQLSTTKGTKVLEIQKFM
jgi:Family of unknown function (DUF5761)